MVATVVMRLRDEGRVDLLDPIAKHIPGIPAGEVTVAQLLSHTSGLSAESPGPWWERTPGMPVEELIGRLGPETARHRPGRRYHYSNLGFGLLGELVARHRDMNWAQAVQQEILRPLGMGDTTPRPRAPHATGYAVHPWADVLLPEPEHDAVAMAPAGQLWSTPPTSPGGRRSWPETPAACSIRPRWPRCASPRPSTTVTPGSTDTAWACSSPARAAAAWPGTPAPCRASWPPCGPTPPTGSVCFSWPTPPRG